MSEPAAASSKRLAIAVAALMLVYWLGGCAAAWFLYYRHVQSEGGLFRLDFGFGPLIESLSRGRGYRVVDANVLLTAHRMPIIPVFLAGIALIRNSTLLALLVKNGITCAILGWTIVRARSLLSTIPVYVGVIALALTLLIPQMIHYFFSLEMEEGYVIAPVAFLMTHFLLISQSPDTRWGWPTWVALFFLNGTLFLIKSSLLPLAIVFAGLFFIATKNWRAGGGFVALVLAGWMMWGLHNLHYSGRFVTTSSWDGWNAYKGNNPWTASYYPRPGLDWLDGMGVIAAPADLRDEWARNDYYWTRFRAFATAQPHQVARLALRKAYVFFVETTMSPTHEGVGTFQAFMSDANQKFMLEFRALQFGAIFLAIEHLLRARPSMRLASIGFLMLLASYSAAYIAGFAYQRHVMVIIPMVSLYLVGCGIPSRIRKTSRIW